MLSIPTLLILWSSDSLAVSKAPLPKSETGFLFANPEIPVAEKA